LKKSLRVCLFFSLFIALMAMNLSVALADDVVVQPLCITATIIGLEEGDEATLALSPESTDATIQKTTIKGISGKSQTVEIDTSLKDGNYQLILTTNDKYFRDPKGYFFQVKNGLIVNPTERPISYSLIPPEQQRFKPYRDVPNRTETNPAPEPILPRYMVERIIGLSCPQKESIQGGAIDSVGYHYAGYYSTLDCPGIWGRFDVTDPGVRHSGAVEFMCDRLYTSRWSGGIQSWIEVGWVERSDLTDTRYMYEYDSVNNDWSLYGNFPDPLEVALLSSGTTWYSMYWDGSSWVGLVAEDLGFSNADFEYNAVEIYTEQSDHPTLPSTTTDISK